MWMILIWGLRIPRVTGQRRGYPGILWGSIPIPRKTGHQGLSNGRTIGASFPLLRWDDDDKHETVSNTKVSKRQTFSNKTLCRSCELSSKVGYSERWLWGMVCWSLFAPLPLPYDDHKMEPKRLVSHKTSIYLRAPLNTGPLRVFCALVPSLVGDVWILVVWVQNLVALQTVW